MTDATDRANALLAAIAIRCSYCRGETAYYPPEHWDICRDAILSERAVKNKAPDTLAVAIKLAEYAEERPESEHDGGCSAGVSKLPCKCSQKDRAEALAEWAGLFRKEQRNASADTTARPGGATRDRA